MSARKRSKATRGKENETDNPILGAIARSSMARSLNDKSPRGFAINFGCDTFSPQMLGWVRHRFDAETRDKIGTIVLCALANGDDRIVEMVRDALQKSERMFHRSHEPTLLRRVGVMMSEEMRY